MDKLHSIIGRILSSEASSRQDLMEAYWDCDFVGDSITVVNAIRDLSPSFSMLDLSMKFKHENRKRLVSLCLEAYIEAANKKIIDEMRSKNNMEYIEIFKRNA